MKCEKCGKKHDGTFGTGRFCSRPCANFRIFKESSNIIKGIKSKQAWANGRFINSKVGSKEAIAKTQQYWLLKRIDWICPVCKTKFNLAPWDAKERKTCSGTCRNKLTNINKNGKVSKAELIIQNLLRSRGYCIVPNDRNILDGLEVDVWIPSINTAIEYNGIYHLKSIHGDQHLKKVQDKDLLKQVRAKEKGIRLIRIEDIQSTPKIVNQLGQLLLDVLRNKPTVTVVKL